MDDLCSLICPRREPTNGLANNHMICETTNWTWRGTDGFLGSEYGPRAMLLCQRANALIPMEKMRGQVFIVDGLIPFSSFAILRLSFLSFSIHVRTLRPA